jgi:5S rRNA maturation endonuclease (ribonuclease M5)
MKNPDRQFEEFIEFLTVFISELNALARDGAAVLVEGKRDKIAMVELGYKGPVITKASLHSQKGIETLRSVRLAVILTDFDGEGRRLAARYAEFFAHRGIDVSLTQRRRLLKAAKGRFLHVENLVRFGPTVQEITAILTGA